MSAEPPVPDFQRYQFAFTRHIRDPKTNARPKGVPARRMAVYNDLLFNNVFSLVSPCFPVAQSILGVRKWKALMRAFFASHRCKTPYFRQLPEEFLQFMQERESAAGEPDFLSYLLHYEWVELALEVTNKEPDAGSIDAAGDLCHERPALTPAHMLLNYPYAVQRISKRYQPTPDQREKTYLLVFRDSADDVRFIVLNSVSARLVALIEPGNLTGNQAVEQVITELQHPQPAAARDGGHAIIRDLRQQGAIVGTIIANPGATA